MNITAVIRGAAHRNGMPFTDLSRRSGIPYQTLMYRLKNPGTWKFMEWAVMLREINFLPDELEIIRKEIEKL